MSSLIEQPPFIPPRERLTGIGWLLSRLVPARKASGLPPDAFCPAAQRQSGGEALTASVIFGLWSFLATGSLMLERTAAPLTALLLWLPAWLIFVHAVILLPPLLLAPFVRPARGTAPPDMARNLSAHAMLLATAWLLLTSQGGFARALGWFWIALMLLETGLRLLRSGLRLARRSI